MDLCLQKEIRPRTCVRFLRHLKTDARGAELFEFAMVFPVLVMLLFGVVWIGRAISVYQALGRAAREGARAYLAPTCATCGNTPGDATTAINDALTAASLDPTLKIYPGVQPISSIDPSDPANYQVAGVTISLGYPVQLNIPFTSQNATTITVTSVVTMRREE